MDVSAEAADLVVKEGLQVTEAAAKLAGSGIKNVAALLLALAKQDFKVTGKTTANRLARDNSPAVVIQVKKEDADKFRRFAKEFGILYFIAQKKDNESGIVNVVSNQNYAAQLNAVMEQMGYPIPQRAKEDEAPKKAKPRAPQEKPSQERGIGSTHSPTTEATEKKPSVRKRLAYLDKVAASMNTAPEKNKEKVR